MRTAILRCLKEAWPQTLDDWYRQRSLLAETAAICAESETGTWNGKLLDQICPEPASAVLLALQSGYRELLPAAFYQLALVPLARHYQDSKHPDYLRKGGRTAKWDMVDRESLLRCMYGRERLRELRDNPGISIRSSKYYFSIGSHPCCSEKLDGLRAFKAENLDYLQFLKLLQQEITRTLCSACRDVNIENIRQVRQAFWDNLPVLFDLETLH